MTDSEGRGQSDPKKGRFGTTLTFVALLALGGLVGWGIDPVMGLLGIDPGETSVSPWVFVPALVLSLLFVLAFHEAGHVVGGKLVGFRFVLFVAGPFKLYSTEGGIRLGLNRSLMLAGGLGGTVPADTRDLTRRMAVYVAGGPVASLLLAATALGLLFAAPPPVGLFLSAIATTSFLVGVVTMIPNRSGGLVSDGARIGMLLAGGPEAERWCAVAALGGASMAGVRPRDWDEELIRRSLSPTDGSFDDAGASITAYYRALDLGETDDAETLLERALAAEGVPEMMRSQVLLEAAFFHAFFRRDADGARVFFSEARPGKVLERHLPSRAEAAVLLTEGDTEGARDKARASLEAIDRSFNVGTTKLEREWLKKISELGSRTDGRRAVR